MGTQESSAVLEVLMSLQQDLKALVISNESINARLSRLEGRVVSPDSVVTSRTIRTSEHTRQQPDLDSPLLRCDRTRGETEANEGLSLYERARIHLAQRKLGSQHAKSEPGGLAVSQNEYGYEVPGPVCEGLESDPSMESMELEPSTRPKHQPSSTLRPMKCACRCKSSADF
eukprot:scaffold112743_cov31-Prasinocladus_malaysianus.AAC.2